MLRQDQKDHVQRVACALLSDNGENAEYDRAISELTAELIGLPLEHAEALKARIFVIRKEWLGI